MIKKEHNSLIFNSNMPWFMLFCLLGVIYLSINSSLWYLLFILLLPFCFRKIKPNIWQILIVITIIIGFTCLAVLAKSFNLISYVNKLISLITEDKVRESMINFIDTKYISETASFIKLILFNIKSKDSYIFYHQVVDLGIVWLFCVSGFHISLITRIIKWIFKKHQRIGLGINLGFVGFYMLILKIPYGCLRIFLTLFYTHFFKRIKLYGFDKLGFIGLNICLFNVNCFTSYGFLLSFIVCMGANYLKKFEIENKLINRLVGNFIFYILTIPFMFDMSKKLSLFTFINTFIFTYLLTGYFLYFLVFTWLIFLAPVHLFLIKVLYVIVGNISFGNIYIYCDKWPIWAKFLFYLGSCILLRISYLIVKNNKI